MDAVEQDKIPLPGELDGEDESPYLRRQKALPVRRSRVSRRLRWALFGVFVLLPVGFAGYGLASFALSSPRFVLNSPDDVIVAGNRFVSREEVLNALGLPLGGAPGSGANIFRISLEAKRRQVESIPWVQSAALTRIFPHRLVVRVVERTPVAFVNSGGRVSLVDSDGVLLEKPEKAVFDFPVLSGLDAAGSLDERRARLALYQEFARQLEEEAFRSGWLVSEVDLADPDDLAALLVQGRETLQVHFGHQDFLERFRNFLALLPEVSKTNTKIDSVDLRYRNQIVVNPQPATPPGKAASPAPSGAMKE
jgi:cell division protein FtsQ